jgi:hypothetical protein
MTGKLTIRSKVRVHEPQTPPLPRPTPPGAVKKRAVPKDLEIKAQRLIHEVGSAEAAKQVIDAVHEQECSSDFLEDSFALRWGFASRKLLLAESKPLFGDGPSNWWATKLRTGRWIVWSRDDFSSRHTFASFEDAKAAVSRSE